MSESLLDEASPGHPAAAIDLPPLVDVPHEAASLERFREVLTETEADALLRDAVEAHETFRGRVVWNVNSTAAGGGVAEMLQSLVPYARGAGVDARWTVIQGDEEFFRVTKRIHNHLHGSPGDGGALDAAAQRHYDAALEVNAGRLIERLGRQDVIMLHDPQTAGLIPALQERGNIVLWRCHVGVDAPNDLARGAWRFLLPYVVKADACVFSSPAFVWEGLDGVRVDIIPPSIDPFAVKNYMLSPSAIAALLKAGGLEDNDSDEAPVFSRSSGDQGRVTRRADVNESTRLTPETPIVTQVSRWDALKDPLGVLRGFVDHVADRSDAHLVLAGPSVAQVADDPEGLRVCRQVQQARAELPAEVAARVHLATLPMDDPEENAVVVNALQRRSTVVVQKSLAEGFGLTVAEAMWKSRPVVASALGGIRDQIEPGRSGLLVDPHDLQAFGGAVMQLLAAPDEADAMGRAAHERIRTEFLGSRHLHQYLELLSSLLR